MVDVSLLIFLCFTFCICEESKLDAFNKKSLSLEVATFTQNIYRHLVETSPNENFLFSPLSLHSALSMLFLAAKDKSATQVELMRTMGFINSQDLLKAAYKKQIGSYQNKTSFLYGNHIWIGEEFRVNKDYRADVKDTFDAEVERINFESPEAAVQVNEWISKTTNNKIQNLVDSFTGDTQMFLANALYFKEAWLVPFDDKDTDGNIMKTEFQTHDEGVIVVDTMQKLTEKIKFGQIRTKGGEMQVASIPFTNQEFEMQIIIPESKKHFEIVESLMSFESLTDSPGQNFNLFSTLKNQSDFAFDEVKLVLPKFSLKTKFNAVDALKKLGATTIFNGKADFDKLKAGGPIKVDNILHEAAIEVTKDGAEGSAATGVELTLFSVGFEKLIVVDKPFMFIIQDKENNIPVLVGRVKNPLQKTP